jgi:hypothetical protein
VPEAEGRFGFLYLTGEHDDLAYRRLVRALSRGRRLAERLPVLFFRKRHVLLRLVNANLRR